MREVPWILSAAILPAAERVGQLATAAWEASHFSSNASDIRRTRAPSGYEFFCSSWISIPAPTTPASAVAKIFGLLTATEFACIAVPYASALSLLVYREMDLKGLYDVLLDTG